MSTPYIRSANDPHALVPFGEDLIEQVTEAARQSPRRRSIIRFHEHEELVQRMLNAIEPESYVRPHFHPAKPETFVAVRGSLLVVRYDQSGTILDVVTVSADGPTRGVEIPPGAWHSILSLEPGTVVFETLLGPYDAATHKVFAEWAPPEEDREAGLSFIAAMRARLEVSVPELAARDQIAAEEEDIC